MYLPYAKALPECSKIVIIIPSINKNSNVKMLLLDQKLVQLAKFLISRILISLSMIVFSVPPIQKLFKIKAAEIMPTIRELRIFFVKNAMIKTRIGGIKIKYSACIEFLVTTTLSFIY